MLRQCAQKAAARELSRSLRLLASVKAQELAPSAGLATTSGRGFLKTTSDNVASPAYHVVRISNRYASSKMFSTSPSFGQNSSATPQEGEERPSNKDAQGPSAGTTTNGNDESQPENGLDTAKYEAGLQARSEEVEDLKDKLARALADMENLRDRTARASEQSRTFAIQKFATGLLDAVDDLERALESVPADAEQQKKDPSNLLHGLRDGIVLTQKSLEKVLNANGVSKLKAEVGQKLDPNLHEAMFDVPNPDAEPGTIAIIVKPGYALNGRVIRPVEVGTVRRS